jgi:catechol 2,3-dioxygenase-like lactoylglutathione lyase family enzyme
MERVTGIGGVFFKARDPKALRAWYREHLGMDVQDWGGTTFRWADDGHAEGVTAWTIFPETTDYLNPSTSPFMINYRVRDLAALLDVLRAEGCTVDDRLDESEFGKFGWVMDPEGNRIELWEPPPATSVG